MDTAKSILSQLFPPDNTAIDTPRDLDLRRNWDLQSLCPPQQINPVTRDEVKLAILTGKKGKSAGPDGLKNDVLAETLKISGNYIEKLYNNCLKANKFPKCFKEADLVILFKGKGKCPLDITSYRPISLINTLGKGLERIVARRIWSELNDKGIISGRQYGFRKGLSMWIRCGYHTKSRYTILPRHLNRHKGSFR